jgi:hypothetical protein
MSHAERLKSLLEPSWPDAEEVQEEIYALVVDFPRFRLSRNTEFETLK